MITKFSEMLTEGSKNYYDTATIEVSIGTLKDIADLAKKLELGKINYKKFSSELLELIAPGDSQRTKFSTEAGVGFGSFAIHMVKLY